MLFSKYYLKSVVDATQLGIKLRNFSSNFSSRTYSVKKIIKLHVSQRFILRKTGAKFTLISSANILPRQIKI